LYKQVELFCQQAKSLHAELEYINKRQKSQANEKAQRAADLAHQVRPRCLRVLRNVQQVRAREVHPQVEERVGVVLVERVVSVCLVYLLAARVRTHRRACVVVKFVLQLQEVVADLVAALACAVPLIQARKRAVVLLGHLAQEAQEVAFLFLVLAIELESL